MPPGPIRDSHTIPAIIETIPTVITRRAPNRATTRGASVEPAKIDSVIGKKQSPASIAS